MSRWVERAGIVTPVTAFLKLATANKLPVRDLSKIDLQATAADIKEYCVLHPFAAYDTAVLTMYNDLPPVFSNAK